MPGVPTVPDHEIVAYERTQRRLVRLKEEMTIETSGALIDALDRLSCVPFASFPIKYGNSKISAYGEACGTLVEPNIDIIMKHSKPSPFGRGEKTVMDETYRRGREITAANISFDWDAFLSNVAELVQSTLFFTSRRIQFKFYKLAIYREGGHFDWHRDTTHSDSHHATLLIALNTSWTGGDFILRRNGVETRVDMKPKPTEREPLLQAVAFYTDTEHKVEPVTDGVRIILQYDVEVEGWKDENNSDRPAQDKNTELMKPKMISDGSGNDDMSDDDDNADPFRSRQGVLSDLEGHNRKRQEIRGSASVGEAEPVDGVLDIVGRLLNEQDEVAFALQYLYRKYSILPEYLKGSDSLVYQALFKTFDVSLHPVVLHEITQVDEKDPFADYNSRAYACKFDHEFEDNVIDTDSDHWSDRDDEKKRERPPTVFHVPRSSALMEINQHDFIDHTGNEPTEWDNKYFGGGMFVKRKGTSTLVGDA